MVSKGKYAHHLYCRWRQAQRVKAAALKGADSFNPPPPANGLVSFSLLHASRCSYQVAEYPMPFTNPQQLTMTGCVGLAVGTPLYMYPLLAAGLYAPGVNPGTDRVVFLRNGNVCAYVLFFFTYTPELLPRPPQTTSRPALVAIEWARGGRGEVTGHHLASSNFHNM
ncbi:hypothetical protein L218DRAFT_605242 [Marasmius fiardii PR-910]|nr:hypothetical protein L218DRAFT_605242 [Marasmius fiardii PR-910]